jgi:hypothetical protein
MSTRRIRAVSSSRAPSSDAIGSAPWPVPCGAMRIPRAGKPDGPRHIGGRLGEHNGGRPLVDGQVPRPARLVVAMITRDQNVAGDGSAQRHHGAMGCGVRHVHLTHPSRFIAAGYAAGSLCCHLLELSVIALLVVRL